MTSGVRSLTGLASQTVPKDSQQQRLHQGSAYMHARVGDSPTVTSSVTNNSKHRVLQNDLNINNVVP